MLENENRKTSGIPWEAYWSLGSRGPARGSRSPGDGKGTREQDETGKAAGGLDSTHPSFYWPRKVPQSNIESGVGKVHSLSHMANDASTGKGKDWGN